MTEELEQLAKEAVICSACFGDGALHRTYVDLPQPRYIGPGYWSAPKRIAFIMLNPGAGKADWRNTEWKQHIERFKNSEESLQEVFSGQRKHMPHWSGGKLISFIELHGLNVDDLAIVNIAWCATQENKYPKWMLKQCFNLHTAAWLENLKPNTLILSGTASHYFEEAIQSLLPQSKIFTSYHYAHRPLDAKKAESRAKEISEALNAT